MRLVVKRIFGPPMGGPREYFYTVDIVRGLAALAVVLFHYQHFYFPPGSMEVLDDAQRSAEPLYHLLWPAYDYGHWAVQLFWGISGFVFSNVYAGTLATGREFWVRRLARLYPLHIITLLMVAGLQLIATGWIGTFLIIGNNDPYHFVLQLFFASFWGFQEGHSFNSPIWSVSVEIISYALFWILLPWLFRWGLLIPVVIVLIARMLLLAHFDNAGIVFILYCIVYFFLGAGINHFVHAVSTKPMLLYGAAIAATAGFLLGGPILTMDPALVVPVAIAACLLSAASAERFGSGRLARKARFVGDSSYGIYLWHLPIQILILLVLDGIVGDRSVIAEPWFVGFFAALACFAGWMSFRFVERPLGTTVLRGLLRD